MRMIPHMEGRAIVDIDLDGMADYFTLPECSDERWRFPIENRIGPHFK